MSLSDLECLAHSNNVPKLILVPLIVIESNDAISSGVIEDYVLLLWVTLKKLGDVDDGVNMQRGFWTRNVEILKIVCDGREMWDREWRS